ADAQLGTHALRLRLATLCEELDDAARDIREPPGAAEGRVEDRQHPHGDERRLLRQKPPVIQPLRLRALVLPAPHPAPLPILVVRREMVEARRDRDIAALREGEAEAELVDHGDELVRVPHAMPPGQRPAVRRETVLERRRWARLPCPILGGHRRRAWRTDRRHATGGLPCTRNGGSSTSGRRTGWGRNAAPGTREAW